MLTPTSHGLWRYPSLLLRQDTLSTAAGWTSFASQQPLLLESQRSKSTHKFAVPSLSVALGDGLLYWQWNSKDSAHGLWRHFPVNLVRASLMRIV